MMQLVVLLDQNELQIGRGLRALFISGTNGKGLVLPTSSEYLLLLVT